MWNLDIYIFKEVRNTQIRTSLVLTGWRLYATLPEFIEMNFQVEKKYVS